MTTLHQTIEVARPAHEVFTYVSDFSTCVEWDATAIYTERLDQQPIGVGSRFKVVCEAPVGNLPLEYEIVEYEPDSKVVLVGRGKWFEVEDTILITPTKKGCELSYTAVFSWKPLMARFADKMQPGLERMGYASVQKGLKAALEDNYPAPDISEENARADAFLPRALSRFTRRGYKRGMKKLFNPMSAYMGDKHIVLTGATSGLGKASAEFLAYKGARLTLVVRNRKKADALVKELKSRTGNKNIRAEIADLSLMADVDKVVANLTKADEPVDVLINNAGALFNPRGETAEGLEQSFALLLLSPYRLTEGLKPLLDKAAQARGEARVINVVSGGMYSQKLRVWDLQSEEDKYSGSVAYARCKRALMIKTEQWAEDWAGDNIVVNAMHPGWADTPGVESSLPEFHKLTRLVLRSPEEGADTINWLAIATEAGKVTGKLFLDREPRTTHLTESTRESAESREQLREILDNWDQTLDDKAA
ncbi:MAG: SDR family NAD(P)-dependent oxidoreductase [Halieaceae bacterium]|jgi:NAD(P)-dependent dehydrogenase (short-subunit alcohol dehydrogenase family)|nr:SDR family NAD(P)-dependent oxidoreductase [Halieaceae bacterium]